VCGGRDWLLVRLVVIDIVIGDDQFKIEGTVTLEQAAPYLAQWFDALALTKRIDTLAHPAGGTSFRLTLAEDTPPSR
jgi:hypothetical protein